MDTHHITRCKITRNIVKHIGGKKFDIIDATKVKPNVKMYSEKEKFTSQIQIT
jgi:hypothetical protein